MPVRVHDERQRVAAARELDLQAALADPQVRVRDGAEAPVAALLAQRLVQQREHAARLVLVDGAGAQRVAGERGHRGGVRALALHVADQRGPRPAAGLEEVVEVAAELDALAGRAEATAADRPGTSGRPPGRSERWRVWAIVRSRS